ncbi:MAG: capsular polysaccharide biosynthesis protein, partial [Desulfosarcina sp.]
VEDLIKAGDAVESLRAAGLIERLVHIQASKYNHVWHAPNLPSDQHPNILLIDQTRGDLSVAYGLADENSFKQMVDAAVKRYPRGRFFVKTHPDVIAGKKSGYLTGKLPPEVTSISQDCNPIALLQQMDHVFTVTSQMGFEALLAGKPVTCFGMPFYAGWGLTDDRMDSPRRGVRRSLEQVFTAAYINYVRYVDPVTGQRCELERILDLIDNHKRIVIQNRGDIYCTGFQWWKRGIVKRFLGSANSNIHFLKHQLARKIDRKIEKIEGTTRLLVWGASEGRQLRDLARRHRIVIERVEDGFIRSVGLGSDLGKPTSLILDGRGIYFDPRRPSDLENMLNSVELDLAARNRATRLRRLIVDSGLSKYNSGCGGMDALCSTEKPVILVPGQVEDDASIQTGCPDVKTNIELLRAVRQANPDACIVFKPHPDVVVGNRVGTVPDNLAKTLCDHIVIDRDIDRCIDQADQIHTMTSLTGFEALLRGKTVYTYGLPFYAGWGLTVDRHRCPRRLKRRSIDELLYCALVLYPRYYDWEAGMFVSVEDAIQSILRARTARQEMLRVSWWRRWSRKSAYLWENIGLLVKE